jgi:tetratricopeptide (TPR) repeat protein
MAIRRFPIDRIRAAEFHETACRLERERAAAPAIVENALRAPRADWSRLSDDRTLLTAGVIERLGEIVATELTRNPKYAAAVAELELSLAQALPADRYPAITLAQLRALAWKDLGKILSYLAHHDKANEAFAEAERQLEPYPILAHDRSVIRLNLAINYQESDRPAEALAVLATCKEVFQAHGDTALLVLTGFYEGRVQQYLHHYREARETYLLLIASTANIPKPTLAALHQCIGLCSIELGDYSAAEANLQKAIALHNELGQTLDAVKGDHGRGLLLLRQGCARRALDVLQLTRHHYLKHSLAEEAGLCGLRMVEALLMLGEFDKAERLARTIMSEFLAASLNTRALTALGYLSEAIASQKASPELASDVHDYVLSLRAEPKREYARPTTAGD